MSRTGSAAAGQSGFTLIEMLVVMAGLALIMAFTMPMLSRTGSRAQLRATAREIAAGLRDTRNLAMVRGHAEAFLVDTARGVYRAGTATKAQTIPNGLRLTMVTAAQDRVDANIGGIQFFADGSSSGGGIRVVADMRHDVVLVDWLTGHVSIFDDTDDAR